MRDLAVAHFLDNSRCALCSSDSPDLQPPVGISQRWFSPNT
jgi:hypothetical protein